MPGQYRLRNTIKYPTSVIVNGINNLGLDVASSLLEQGGYVVFIDVFNEKNISILKQKFGDDTLVSFLDFAAIPHLEEDLRRLDYVFYFNHEGIGTDSENEISTQDFLKYSNYLDTVLSFSVQFEAKFLLSTSIRAHLKLMDQLDLELTYGGNNQARTSYTDLEIQRYAESLCLEYVKKSELDARIIRVGEIIGDGIDLGKRSVFIDMIMNAVLGKSLEVRNDGLESEWYVHLLDAAYGIVRAQFTREIKGRTYSLSYAEPVSELSLAYKVQELEPNAQEIEFVMDESLLTPLKLHKPAPNLGEIGWKPKVDIDQSIKESLVAAKNVALGLESNEGISDTVLSKLRELLPIHSQGESDPGEESSGPVSRLIKEREIQENARKQSLENANTKIKKSKDTRRFSIGEKIQRWFYRNIFDSRTNFPLLRRITPVQFLALVGFGVIFGFIYLTIFSPVIVTARNTYLLNSILNEANQSLQQGNIVELESQLSQAKSLVSETSDMVNILMPSARLVALDGYLRDIGEYLDIYSDYLEGAQNIAYAVVPLQEYLDAYTDNIEFRPSSENYLSVTPGTDYSIFLDDLETKKAYAKLGEEMMSQAKLQMSNINYSTMPKPAVEVLDKLGSKLIALENISDYAGLSFYLSDTLGGKVPRTYLFFITDNSRPMPIGGKLSAYLLVTFQNGSISEIKVQSLADFKPKLDDLPEYVVDTINSASFVQNKNIELGDLARIGNVEIFTDAIKDIWEDSFGQQIHMVGILNLESLIKMMEVSGVVTVEGIEIDPLQALQSIADLQGQNPTAIRRDDIIAQVLANQVDSILNNYRDNFTDIISFFDSAGATKDLIIARNDLAINELVDKLELYSDLVDKVDMGVRFSIISDDTTLTPVRFPTFVENLEAKVNQDSSMDLRLLAKFPTIANVDEVQLCLPRVSKGINVAGVNQLRVKQTSLNNSKCLVANVINETEVSFSWSTLPFESSAKPEYNLSIGQSKPPGIQVEYSLEISLAPSLTFSEIRPAVSSIGGKLAISRSLIKDQIIRFIISK